PVPARSSTRESGFSCAGAFANASRFDVVAIPAPGGGNAVAQGNGRLPAERREAGIAHQLARRAVGPGSVMFDAALEAHGFGHDRGKLIDREVGARADI